MATKHNSRSTPEPGRPDVTKEFTDNRGRSFLLSVQFKRFNDRPEIFSLTIRSSDPESPITRRVLQELPLETIFGDELSVETEHLTRILGKSGGSSAHQGRQHTDEDLKEVAAVYRAAFMARIPVQKAIADAFGISLSTAAKRIMAARSRGYITTQNRDN